jgi:hypothetical protein
VVGGEGVDQAGNEGQAKHGNGAVAPGVADEGAINPLGLPPCFGVGGRDRTKLGLKDGPSAAIVLLPLE